jgi:hypothetical protein
VTADTDVEIDRPEVIAEVLAAFHRYERALTEADLAVLTELFWDDPRTVRYGLDDRQRGAEQVAAWRRDHPSVPPGRRLRETTVLAVDDRMAVVNTLFHYPAADAGHGGPCPTPEEGRQSQTWVRFAHGWRIVAAHVSQTRHPD